MKRKFFHCLSNLMFLLNKKNRPVVVLCLALFLLDSCVNSEEKLQAAAVDTQQLAQKDSLLAVEKVEKELKITTKQKKKRKLFAWYPYFMGKSYTKYDFTKFWGISYFAYELHPKTGKYKKIHEWLTTPLIERARQVNCKIFLTIKNHGAANNRKFLSNSKAQQTFIQTVIPLLEARKADGITLDFEEIPVSESRSFTQFIKKISVALKKSSPHFQLQLVMPPIFDNQLFDINQLKYQINTFLIMGYDYHAYKSEIAGPVAPLNSGKKWGQHNLNNTIKSYLAEGVPKEKIILTLPLYGHQWQTEKQTMGAKVIRYHKAWTYRQIAQKIAISKTKWEQGSDSRYYWYTDKQGRHFQLWYDDATTLKNKAELVDAYDLAGVGVWALGYAKAEDAVWRALVGGE